MTDTSNTGAAAPTDSTASTNAPVASSGFTAEQQRTLAGDAVARGQLSRADANAALAADNISPLDDPAAQQAGGPGASDKQAEVAQYEAMCPPARAEEFQVPNLVAPGETVPAEQVIAVTQKIQGYLADARFSKEVGNSLLREADRTSVKYAAMSETERTAYGASERAKLAKIYGPATDQKIKLANQLVQELEAKSPGIIALLETTGAGNNALIVSHVVAAAERLLARRGD